MMKNIVMILTTNKNGKISSKSLKKSRSCSYSISTKINKKNQNDSARYVIREIYIVRYI